MNTTKSKSSTANKSRSGGGSMNKEKGNGNNTSSRKGMQEAHADKTKTELLEVAKKLQITGRHDMTKDELIKAIGKQEKK